MRNDSMTWEAKAVLLQLVEAITQLGYDEYTQPIPMLSNSTIGEHTRHIIELFEQLNSGFESGNINYDNRKRNIRTQQDIDFASEKIAHIIQGLEKENKTLHLVTLYNNNEMAVETNYHRELMYNIEHCIHHQALIKVGLLYLGKMDMTENFGVAKSTIINNNQCAQ